MASDQPTATPTTTIHPDTRSPGATQHDGHLLPTRLPSLKRTRGEASPPPSSSSPYKHVNLRLSPSPKSPRYSSHFPPAYMPMQLTGAAALAEEQRRRTDEAHPATSDNPSHRAVAALLAGGGSSATSKASVNPGPTTSMSQGMAIAANAMSLQSPGLHGREDNSPTSVTSLASLGNTASTATANSTSVASPPHLSALVESALREGRNSTIERDASQAHGDDQQRPVSLAFPGPYSSYPEPSEGNRQDPQDASGLMQPKSPSIKKHRCPYCETEFTRHHNLKSHLLTHSQEKPYECQTCHSKFRRLHDLKRHTKLHTGERPHTCPICKRKFARGDALARHTKGPGGCAGRRGSQGVDAGNEDDFEASQLGDGTEIMDGITYTDGLSRSMAEEYDEEQRRLSLPSIKAQHVADAQGSTDSHSAHSRTPSTYPPAGPRPSVHSPGGLYPPAAGTSLSGGASPNLGASPTSGTSMPLAPMSGANPILPPGGMTESPKPLSPSGQQAAQLGHESLGATINRPRSPSLTTHFQQTHFSRRQSGRATPPGMSLPSPLSSQGPKLPSLTGLPHSESRFGLHGHASITTNGPVTNPMFQAPLTSMNTALSEGGSSSNFFVAKSNERDMLNHIQKLEEQVKSLTEKVALMEQREKVMAAQMQEEKMSRLEAENAQLRGQLDRHSQRIS